MKSRAFTLIELLISIAVIVVLAGVLFPVFAKAKLKAKETNSMSNLRQCSFALLLYSNEYGGDQFMPPYNSAVDYLRKSPTCDLNDYWRKDCKESSVAPLVGSYGYVRGSVVADTDDHWADYYSDQTIGKNLLICAFYGSNRLNKFDGDIEPPTCGSPIEGCRYPDRLLIARLDGSVAGLNNRFGGSVQSGGFLFSWSSAFAWRF